jgi:hypothetical protein
MSEKYQPYKSSNEDGSNALKANEGAGATEAYRPNGWPENFEHNTSDERKNS